MSEVLQRQTYQADNLIFKEGDEGNLAYIVQSGEVEIVKTIDDEEKVLGTVGQGGIFGKMALIDAKPRHGICPSLKGLNYHRRDTGDVRSKVKFLRSVHPWSA